MWSSFLRADGYGGAARGSTVYAEGARGIRRFMPASGPPHPLTEKSTREIEMQVKRNLKRRVWRGSLFTIHDLSIKDVPEMRFAG
jgi:hypothetical protein